MNVKVVTETKVVVSLDEDEAVNLSRRLLRILDGPEKSEVLEELSSLLISSGHGAQ